MTYGESDSGQLGWSNGPSFPARSLVALLLRLALGLQLLHAGISGFFLRQAMVGGGGGNPWSLTPFGPGPGNDFTTMTLPYLQISVALALLLGFFTVVAAGISGVLALLPLVIQVLMLLGNWPTSNMGGFGMRTGEPFLQMLTYSVSLHVIALSSGLIWISGSGYDAWSLDGLVFSDRRARPRGSKPAKTLQFVDELSDASDSAGREARA